MNHRATAVAGHTRKTALGVALVALLAASVGLAPAAIAGTTPTRISQHARARALQAEALAAARLATPAGRPVHKANGPAKVAAPHAAGAVKGPALLMSQLTNGGSTIGRLDLATGNVTTLDTGSLPCVTGPRLSPDGSTIVAVTYSDPSCLVGTSTIATFDASTGALLQTLDSISAGALNYFEAPSWSPDGTKILYTRWTSIAVYLYTVPAVGGTSATVLRTGMFDGVYSPDGTMIVAADLNLDRLDILNGDGVPQGSIAAASTPAAPAWSPDSSRISFSYDKADSGGHNRGIAVINADGTGLSALKSTTADTTTNAFSSTWSDDGTQIFYDALGVVPGSNPAHYTAPPTIYATDALTGTYRATVRTATPTTVFVDPFFVLSNPPAIPTASTYTPIAPVRVQPLILLGPGVMWDVQVTGVAGIPAGATAVTVNLTGVGATATTFLTAYPTPADTSFPVVSNLNLTKGQTAAIAVQVPVSATGSIRIRNSAGTTGVIVDVSGYFQAGKGAAGYVPLTAPVRRLDQRIGAGASATVNVAGITGAPANSVAVVLNLTGDQPSVGTWESVVPSPMPTKPTVSSLNLPKGTTRANLVTAKIGADGSVVVYNAAGTVRTIADVVGFYTSDPAGLAYYPLNPLRILDTRDGTHTALGSTVALGQARFLDLPTYGTIVTATGITAVPTWATAVAANLTGVSPTVGTFLSTVASPGTTNTSSVNLPRGGVVPNLVISSVGTAAGAVRIKNAAGTIHVIADLAGYYGPPQP